MANPGAGKALLALGLGNRYTVLASVVMLKYARFVSAEFSGRNRCEQEISQGMYCKLDGAGADRVNSFALVTYIPEPMGSYLNSLREELVPNCNVYSHVTVLPPRALQGLVEDAWERIVREASETPVFDIETTKIEIFPVTSVIYLAIGEGSQELRRMHDRLNRYELAYDEPYLYHPHITLAQELPADRVAEAFELATRRWEEFSHSRRFPLDHVTFVQNTAQKQWLDLKEVPLAEPAPVVKV